MFSPNGIKTVLFDLDGTLRLNLPPGGEVFTEYVTRLGFPISQEDHLRSERWEHYYWASSPDLKSDHDLYGGETRDFWRNYSRRRLIALGIAPQVAFDLAEQVTHYMEENYRPQTLVAEGAIPVLRQLQEAGYRLAVVSNRAHPYHEELERLGLASFFEFALAGGEINSYKPQPGIFETALQRLETHPRQAIYVGDNYFADVIGARQAGLWPVLYDPRGIFPEAGCPILTSFSALPLILSPRFA